MNTSLDHSALAEASAALREANLAFAKAHPGESPGRQPVHTVYGGAQLFKSDSVPKLGAIALRAMDQYASKPVTLRTCDDAGREARFSEVRAERWTRPRASAITHLPMGRRSSRPLDGAAVT